MILALVPAPAAAEDAVVILKPEPNSAFDKTLPLPTLIGVSDEVPEEVSVYSTINVSGSPLLATIVSRILTLTCGFGDCTVNTFPISCVSSNPVNGVDANLMNSTLLFKVRLPPLTAPPSLNILDPNLSISLFIIV